MEGSVIPGNWFICRLCLVSCCFNKRMLFALPVLPMYITVQTSPTSVTDGFLAQRTVHRQIQGIFARLRRPFGHPGILLCSQSMLTKLDGHLTTKASSPRAPSHAFVWRKAPRSGLPHQDVAGLRTALGVLFLLDRSTCAVSGIPHVSEAADAAPDFPPR
jgi:hypothetical protein